jgi:hypothetical protein
VPRFDRLRTSCLPTERWTCPQRIEGR